MANSPIMINKKAIPEEGIRLDKNYSASTNALGQAGTTNSVAATFGLAANSVLLHLGGTVIRGSGIPGDPSDLITKSYADSLSAGLSWKAPVKAATTADGTLATAFANGQAIDGFTLTTGDRILIKDQTSGGGTADNGIYIVTAGAPTRAADMSVWDEVPAAAVFVEQGTANGDKGFVCTSDSGAFTVGTDPIVFVQFTSTTAVGFATSAPGGSNIAGKVSVDTTRATTGSGLLIDSGSGNDGEIYINLGATPGLEIASNALSVKLGATPALALAGGLSVLLDPTNPGLQKTSGLKVLLDTNPGLQLGAAGLSIDLDANPGLQLAVGGLSVLLAGANSGLTTTGGLAIALGADPGLEFASDQLEAKVNTSASMSKTASGLEVVLKATGGLEHETTNGIQINLEATNPTLQINGSNELGIKIAAGDESLVALAAGVKASATISVIHAMTGYSGTGNRVITLATPIAAGYTSVSRVAVSIINGPNMKPDAALYTVDSATQVTIINADYLADTDELVLTYTAKAA